MQQKFQQIRHDQLIGKISFELAMTRMKQIQEQMDRKFHNQIFAKEQQGLGDQLDFLPAMNSFDHQNQQERPWSYHPNFERSGTGKTHQHPQMQNGDLTSLNLAGQTIKGSDNYESSIYETSPILHSHTSL